MKPILYYHQTTKEGHQLYLGEYSTIDGLRLIEPTRGIKITGLEGPTEDGWLSTQDLPNLLTVSEVIDFLEASNELSLIDFDASIEGGVSLSTHDDGECSFIFSTQKELLQVLYKAAAKTPPGFLDQLVRSPGMYMECDADGTIRRYDSFDAYAEAYGFGSTKKQ